MRPTLHRIADLARLGLIRARNRRRPRAGHDVTFHFGSPIKGFRLQETEMHDPIHRPEEVLTLSGDELRDGIARLRARVLQDQGFRESANPNEITCPNCGESHPPAFCIDRQTGICSDACWDEFLGEGR